MNPVVTFALAAAVFVCVLAAVLWLWDTYEVGRLVGSDSDTDTQ